MTKTDVVFVKGMNIHNVVILAQNFGVSVVTTPTTTTTTKTLDARRTAGSLLTPVETLRN